MPTSSKRKLKKYPKQVIKEREIKVIGKLPEESKFILSLRKKKTSPKTLEVQKAKTAKSEPVLFWDSANGTYVKSEQQ